MANKDNPGKGALQQSSPRTMPASRGFGEYRPGICKLLTGHFGLPISPLESLENDGDWAFVVKMHGYVETAVNRLITMNLDKPELNSFIHDLDMANDRRGKVALVKALKLLPDDGCLFVKTLSQFRGRIVHDVKWLDLDLSNYFGELSRGDSDRWKSALTWWHFGKAEPKDKEAAMKHPRHSIFTCTMQIMARVTIQFHNRKSDQAKLDETLRSVAVFWSEPHKDETPPESISSQS